MGRCTFFALVFSAVGLYGWLHLNRDLTSFALFAGAIQALLLAHSYKQDVANQQQIQNQQQTIDVNIQK
jgi:cell division protein FtsL